MGVSGIGVWTGTLELGVLVMCTSLICLPVGGVNLEMMVVEMVVAVEVVVVVLVGAGGCCCCLRGGF